MLFNLSATVQVEISTIFAFAVRNPIPYELCFQPAQLGISLGEQQLVYFMLYSILVLCIAAQVNTHRVFPQLLEHTFNSSGDFFLQLPVLQILPQIWKGSE